MAKPAEYKKNPVCFDVILRGQAGGREKEKKVKTFAYFGDSEDV